MTKSQVTTFYSYKGGSGRSMALSNVAWALASNGEKVLAIDWDLEAPGLNRYFHPFLRDPEQGSSRGLIDRIWEYVQSIAGRDLDKKSRFELANCDDLVQSLDLPVSNAGCLHFIGAGLQDDQYSEKVNGLDWTSFYRRFDGETFINRLIDWARKRYTHVLIDSRTGVADTAGICTTQLPDALVLCFVYNRQSIEGTASIARSIIDARKNYKKPAARMEFVPSRVEERSAVEPARRYMAQRLVSAIDGNPKTIDQTLRLAEIRNYPWCAFEEKLAVFEELPDERGSLLEAMHDLAQRVSGSKNLKIVPVDPTILSSYWQRAAFADPRVFDLRALGGMHDSPDSWKQVQYWLEATDNSPKERSDWLIELGETSIAYATSRENGLSPSTADYFVSTGLKLARRAIAQDPYSYQTRLAFLLHQVGGYLQRKGDLTAALEIVNEAEMQWRRNASAMVRWRGALTLERKAAILDSMGESEEALEVYREIIDLYETLGRRKLPIGAELGPARTHRLLARKLVEKGDIEEANRIITIAVKVISRFVSPTRERDASEVLDILIARLQIATLAEPENIHEIGHRVLIIADKLVPTEIARDQLYSELFIAQAEVLASLGQFEEALSLLRTVPDELQPRPRMIELRARLLMSLHRSAEAADLLSKGIADGDIQITGSSLDTLMRAFHESGQEERFYETLLEALSQSKSHDLRGMNQLLKLVLKGARLSKGERNEVGLSKLAEILPSLIGKKD